jgi:hypothetical protein
MADRRNSADKGGRPNKSAQWPEHVDAAEADTSKTTPGQAADESRAAKYNRIEPEESRELHTVCAGNCEATLKAAGADASLPDTGGWTPVHFAAWAGHDQCIAALTAAGADVCAADSKGRTPIFVAAAKGNHRCIAALKAAGPTSARLTITEWHRCLSPLRKGMINASQH